MCHAQSVSDTTKCVTQTRHWHTGKAIIIERPKTTYYLTIDIIVSNSIKTTKDGGGCMYVCMYEHYTNIIQYKIS